MTVNRANNDLSRFQFSCPAWWQGFLRGQAEGRRKAQDEGAEWSAADWQRGKIEREVA
jgi:hypothetical protein